MDVECQDPFILIYYRFRGQAQAIRMLFCYLGISFVEVHLEEYDKCKNRLPQIVVNKLKCLKIDKSQLPLLVNNDELIYDIYPIMAYACYKLNREELLGSDMANKVRVQQIMEVYSVKQPQSMMQFFRFADYVSKHTKREVQIQQTKSYSNLMRHSMYLKQICQLLHHYSNGYVLGQRTILDFLFYQSCVYMLGGFNNLDKQNRNLPSPQDNSVPTVEYSLLRCLDTMRKFKKQKASELYYQNNKAYLQSFTIFSPTLTEDKRESVRKFWLGSPYLVKER